VYGTAGGKAKSNARRPAHPLETIYPKSFKGGTNPGVKIVGVPDGNARRAPGIRPDPLGTTGRRGGGSRPLPVR